MTEVDQRIVAMHFDNKQFEKGAKETIETLEQLRESLDLEESAKSLNTLADSAKDLDFDQAAKSATKLHEALSVVQKVASKTFSVATFPIRALGNALGGLAKDVRKWFGIDLARNIEQAATSAIKSLTIDPLSTGWNEYEMKMDSVKTIMTGTSKEFATLSDDEHLGKVKSTLEELNRYADETIYSFKDMTASIGKFTNAGVHLDVAAKSMMGISNLAAQAGQGVQQANMAMYNFSQSLSMGYVEARDWRSIENANMATLDFKETLVDIGVLMGTLQKDSKGVIKTNVKGQKKVAVTAEGIRDSLQYRWLTSDVLTTALEIYSGEMSIEQIMERLPGLTEEQAQALYQVGQEAKEAATQVRTFSKMFDALKEAAQSGWATSWELIFGDLNEATALWTSINDRISAVLNDMAETRNNILLGWRGMTKDKDGNLIKVSDYDGRQDLIDSLMKVFDIVDHIGHAISVAWESVFGKFGSEQLISATKAFSGFISQIAAWIGTFDDPASGANKLAKILKGLFSVVKVLWNITKGFATTIKKIVMPVLDPLIDIFALLGELIYDLVNGQEIGDDLGERFVKSFNALWGGIKKGFADGFSYIKDSVLKLFGINTEEIGRKIEEAGGLHEIIKNTFKSILATLVEWVNYVMSGKAFEDLKKWFSDNWKAIEEAILGKEVWNFKTGKTTRSTPFGRMVFDLIAGFDSAIESIKSGEILSRIQAKFTEIYEGIKKFFVGEDIQTNIENDLGTGFITAHKAGLFDRLLAAISTSWPSAASWLGTIKEQIGGFIETVGGWSGWTTLSDFFTNNIITPIRDFVTSKDGSPSQLRIIFTRISTSVSAFWGKVKAWSGWTTLGNFFIERIINPIHDFVTSKDGNPSQLSITFTRISTRVSAFLGKVKAWSGWTTLGNFFTERIINPIRDFVTSKDGNPSRLKTTFDNVVSHVTELWNTVQSWSGWTALWDFFNNHIITPIRKLYNFLFHGDENFSEKDKSAKSPIGAIASATASDRPLLKREASTSSSLISSVATELTSSLQGIVDSTNVFDTGEEAGGPINKAVSWIEQLGLNLEETWNNIKAPFERIANKITELVDSIRTSTQATIKWMTEEDWETDFDILMEKLGTLGETVGKIGVGFNIGSLLFGTGSFLGGLGQFFSGGGSLLKKTGKKGRFGFNINFQGFSDFFKSLGRQVKKEGIGGIAKSIGRAKAAEKEANVSSVERVRSFAELVLAFAGSVELLVMAVNSLIDNLEELDKNPNKDAILENFKNVMTNLVGALGVTEVIGLASSIFGQQKVNTVFTSLIGFAGAVEALVIAVGQIATMAKEGKDLDGAITVLDKIVQIVTVFSLLQGMSLGGSYTGGNEGIRGLVAFGQGKSSGLIGFALAITALIYAVKDLANIGASLDDVTVDGEVVKSKFKGAIDVLNAIKDLINSFVLTANLTTSKAELGFNSGAKNNFLFKGDKSSQFYQKMNQKGNGSFNAMVSLGENKSAGLIGFMAAMWVILTQVEAIAKVDKSKLDSATEAISSIGAVIGHFVEVANLTTSNASIQFGSFDVGVGLGRNKSSGLLGFIAGMWLLIEEVIKLSNADLSKINAAKKVIEALGKMLTDFVGTQNLGKLLGANVEVAGFKYKGGKTNGLIGFVLAISVLLAEVVGLAKFDDETKLNNAVTIIEKLGELITSFTVLFDVTSFIGSVGQRIAGIFAIAILAGAIWLILQTVADIAKMNVTEYERAKETITLVKDIISSIGTVLFASDGFIAIATAIGKMGAEGKALTGGLAAAGVLVGALIVAVLGIALLAQALAFAYRDGIGVKDLEYGITIAGKIGEFIGSFIGGITGAKKAKETEKDMEGAGKGIQAFVKITSELTDEDMNHAIGIMTKIADFSDTLKGFDPTLWGQLFGGDITLGKFASYMGEIATGLWKLGDLTGYPTNEVMIALGAMESIAAIMRDLSAGIEIGAADEFLRFIAGLTETEFFGEVTPINWSYFYSVFEELGAAVKRGIDSAAGSEGIGTPIIDQIVQSIQNGSSRITEAVAAAVRAGLQGVDLSKPTDDKSTITVPADASVVETVTQTAEQLTDTMNRKVTSTVAGVSSVAEKATNTLVGGAFDMLGTVFEGGDAGEAAAQLGDLFASTFTDAGSEVSGIIQHDWVGIGKEAEEATYDAAKNIPTAAANAVADNSELADNAIGNMADSMVSMYQNKLKIQSPSKVFYNLAKFIPMAVGLSIKDYTYTAVQAVYDLGSDLFAAMNVALSPIDEMLSDRFTITPRITPVFDMSNANSNVAAIGNMFGNGAGMYPGFARSTPDVKIDTSSMAQYVSAVNERLDQLNENISHMQMVLDTGALVAHTVVAYDRALGARATMTRK